MEYQTDVIHVLQEMTIVMEYVTKMIYVRQEQILKIKILMEYQMHVMYVQPVHQMMQMEIVYVII